MRHAFRHIIFEEAEEEEQRNFPNRLPNEGCRKFLRLRKPLLTEAAYLIRFDF